MALTRRLERKQLPSDEPTADDPLAPTPAPTHPPNSDHPGDPEPHAGAPDASARRVTRSQTGTRTTKRARTDATPEESSPRAKKRRAPRKPATASARAAAAESEDSERTAAEGDAQPDGEIPTRPNSPVSGVAAQPPDGSGASHVTPSLSELSMAGAPTPLTPAASIDWIPKARRRGRPLPVPVPNLTKKSRGRRVPTTASMMSIASEGGETTANEEEQEGAKAASEEKEENQEKMPEQVVEKEKEKEKEENGEVADDAAAPPMTNASGSRIYMCQVHDCGKLFSRGEHLKRHIRSIHTYEKPYKCNFPACGKFFSRHDNLLQHRKIHKDGGGDDPGEDEGEQPSASTSTGRSASRRRVKSRATASDSPPATDAGPSGSTDAGPSGSLARSHTHPGGAPSFMPNGGPNSLGIGALAPSPLRYAYTYPLHLSLPGGPPMGVPGLPLGMVHAPPPPPGMEHLPPGAALYAAQGGAPPGYAYPYSYAYPYAFSAAPATSAVREPGGVPGGAGGEGGQPSPGRDGRPGMPGRGAPGEGSFTYGVSSLRTGQEEPVSAGAPAADGDGAGDTDVEGDGPSAGGQVPQRPSPMHNGAHDQQTGINAGSAAPAGSGVAAAPQHAGMAFALDPSLAAPMAQVAHDLAALPFSDGQSFMNAMNALIGHSLEQNATEPPTSPTQHGGEAVGGPPSAHSLPDEHADTISAGAGGGQALADRDEQARADGQSQYIDGIGA